MLLMISVISLVFKISFIENEIVHFSFFSLALYISLIITFLFYFIGDLHDIVVGKGIYIDSKMYFSSRTKFKDILFHIGDMLKYGILLGSISLSVAMLLIAKDVVLAVNILSMWLIYCIIGFTSMLWYQNSYISLLLIEVFLIALSFFMVM